jgi:DNA-directed RNA polymerase subunit H (RpoH/RPB5)
MFASGPAAATTTSSSHDVGVLSTASTPPKKYSVDGPYETLIRRAANAWPVSWTSPARKQSAATAIAAPHVTVAGHAGWVVGKRLSPSTTATSGTTSAQLPWIRTSDPAVVNLRPGILLIPRSRPRAGRRPPASDHGR